MDSLPEGLAPPDFSVLREVTLDPLPVPVTVFLYVLTDPRTGRIRYVGQARNPRKRLSEHITEARTFSKTEDSRYAWISELNRLGLRPRMFLLETVPADCARQRERAWVQYFLGRGETLTNSKMRSRRSVNLGRALQTDG